MDPDAKLYYKQLLERSPLLISMPTPRPPLKVEHACLPQTPLPSPTPTLHPQVEERGEGKRSIRGECVGGRHAQPSAERGGGLIIFYGTWLHSTENSG